jgi:hypothetical protein
MCIYTHVCIFCYPLDSWEIYFSQHPKLKRIDSLHAEMATVPKVETLKYTEMATVGLIRNI